MRKQALWGRGWEIDAGGNDRSSWGRGEAALQELGVVVAGGGGGGDSEAGERPKRSRVGARWRSCGWRGRGACAEREEAKCGAGGGVPLKSDGE